MRRAVVLALAVLTAVPAAAGAATPTVDLQVVGKTKVLRAAAPVKAKATTVRVGGKRCAVAAGTPLAALARTPLRLGLRDYGSCGRKPRDAASLYVRAVAGERGKGEDGWVYKIGAKTPGQGAGDPGSRVKPGRELLWFWCDMGKTGCQRTLKVVPTSDAALAGQSVGVTVIGYDDQGKGKPVAGATVRGGAADVVTSADGTATVQVPAGSASLDLVATQAGMVQSFPAGVQVG